MAKSAETPLMQQYGSIKAKYPDALLLFRVGDFYETFGSDAITASGVLGITLTLAVTWLAAPVGPRWSGVLAVFPLLSTVVAADTHRRHGGAYAAALLSAMVDAFWAFAAFCVALVLLLDRLAPAAAFAAAVALALVVQGLMLLGRR